MTVILLLFAIFLIIYSAYYIYNYNEVVFVKADDNHNYLIQNGSNSQEYLLESANTLSEINSRVEKLINHLEKNFSDDPTTNYFIKMLKKNYDSSILSEAAIDSRYTTYTIDKHDMHVCLRTRDSTENLYDINILMYVVLHELAHVCNYDRDENPIIGHGVEFKRIFKFLIVESIKIGIYIYKDYSVMPEEYCGIYINTSILPQSHLSLYLN